MDKQIKVTSLAKAIHVLECFSITHPELGITEISKMLNLQKSTVHNIASTFEAMGYLKQNQETSKFSLGIKLLQFSYIINNHMGIGKFFLPYLKDIANQVNETVYLGIPHESEVLYIDCQAPESSPVSRNILGEHAPIYCTGLGKAMLAFLPEEIQEQLVKGPMQRFTENTITTETGLRENLKQVREQGFAIDDMEHEFGVTCIAFPVFGNDRRVIAAVSVSAPSLRFDRDTLLKAANVIKTVLEPAQYVL